MNCGTDCGTGYECVICLEEVEINKNITFTQCGHCFHSNCLIKNIAYNGYNCPYCRSSMADIPNNFRTIRENYNETDSESDSDGSDNSDNKSENESENVSDNESEAGYVYQRNQSTLREENMLLSFRLFHQRLNEANEVELINQYENDNQENEEDLIEIENQNYRNRNEENKENENNENEEKDDGDDDDEDEEENILISTQTRPSLDYISQKLIENNVSFNDLLVSLLIHHNDFSHIHDVDVSEQIIYSNIKTIISEYKNRNNNNNNRN